MKILILGVKPPIPASLLAKGKIVGQTRPIAEFKNLPLAHLEIETKNLRQTARCFHDLYQACQDKTIAARAQRLSLGAEYIRDPACLVARACEVGKECPRFCAEDIWSTPHYHLAAASGRVQEDCDGLTLGGAPWLGGRPLFVKAGRPDEEHHVMTLVDAKRATVAGREGLAALDLSLMAGMPPYNGSERECLWLDDTGREVFGRLHGPLAQSNYAFGVIQS